MLVGGGFEWFSLGGLAGLGRFGKKWEMSGVMKWKATIPIIKHFVNAFLIYLYIMWKRVDFENSTQL
jgi:hypothetical protein